MSTQPLSAWDATPFEETRAKVRGMRVAAAAHNRDLALAREIARELGADGGVISADDVRRVMADRFPEDFGAGVAIPRRNWMGSCFVGEEWECKGWTRSKAKGAHMNPIRLWALKEVKR